jgi:hypothetical protein
MRGSARRHRPSTAFFWNPSNMTAHFVFIVQVLCAVVLPLASSFTRPPHTRTEPITSLPLNVQSPSTWSGQPPLEVMTISYRRQGVVPARLPCLIHSVYDCIASSLPPLHRTSQYHSPHVVCSIPTDAGLWRYLGDSGLIFLEVRVISFLGSLCPLIAFVTFPDPNVRASTAHFELRGQCHRRTSRRGAYR